MSDEQIPSRWPESSPIVFRADSRAYVEACMRVRRQLDRARRDALREALRDSCKSFAAGFCAGALSMAVIIALTVGVLVRATP